VFRGKGSEDLVVEARPASDKAPIFVELNPLESSQGNDSRSNVLKSMGHFAERFVVPSTVMIRRACLATSGLLDPFIPFSGDYDLLIKLGSRHPVLRVASEDVLYRKHEQNYSDQYEVGRGEVAALIDRYVAFARATGDRLLERGACFRLRRMTERGGV
jgi:hypothetical protein